MVPLGIITVIIQVLTVVHIVRNRRDQYWIYIVIFVPMVGAIAYFIVEIMPGLFHARQTHAVVRNIKKIINPEKEIRELEAALAFSDTFDNRKALAEGYFNHGSYEQAIQIFRSCLQGMHKENPYIMESLAKTYYHNGNYTEARDLILKLSAMPKNTMAPATQLLLALAYENLGDPAEAEKVYSTLIKSFPGEEARYRYAQLLGKLGKQSEAIKVLNELLTVAEHSPRFYVREQQQWIELAKKALAEK